MTKAIALIGIGEVAKSQHIPAIHQSGEWELAATVSPVDSVSGIHNFTSVGELLSARPDISTVAICTPPAPRTEIAMQCIQHGKHVLLEKPPAVTVGECKELIDQAAMFGVSLYASWHSRESSAVDAARNWLADTELQTIEVQWEEDVRIWHPDQEWIWQPGGFGVFDPGINALAILTEILPWEITIAAALLVIPANRDTAIAATLELATRNRILGQASFDWRRRGGQIWDIRITSDKGRLVLSEGGTQLTINGVGKTTAGFSVPLQGEYPRIYRRFSDLIASGTSDFDFKPLQLVEEALSLAVRTSAEAF